jgi:hypothetical protein
MQDAETGTKVLQGDGDGIDATGARRDGDGIDATGARRDGDGIDATGARRDGDGIDATGDVSNGTKVMRVEGDKIFMYFSESGTLAKEVRSASTSMLMCNDEESRELQVNAIALLMFGV